MSVEIDLRSRTPIYEQIISNIKEQAIAGKLKPDEQIPSIRQLTRELGINPNTIHKAYSELERQGVIYSLAGRGAFIAGVPEMQKLTEIKCEELLKDIENSIVNAKSLKVEKKSIEKIVDKVYTGSMSEPLRKSLGDEFI